MVVMEAMRSMICSRCSPAAGFDVFCMAKRMMSIDIDIFKGKKTKGLGLSQTFLSCTHWIPDRHLDFGDGSCTVAKQVRIEILPTISFTLTTQNHGRQIPESEPEEVLTETGQGQQRVQSEAAAGDGNQSVLYQEIAAI
jgi:hypothetical protein